MAPTSGTPKATRSASHRTTPNESDLRATPAAAAARPTFFETANEFGAWLAKNGATARELVVGLFKRKSDGRGMTWPQAVDEALCHGWIDGVRTNIDARSYKIRFTPRKATSTWSARNIDRVTLLQGEGRMQPAGLEAFAQRHEAKSGTYAYEQPGMAQLAPEEDALFRQNRAAAKFFDAQPRGYRHLAIWHVVSAKRVATRQARLAKLIEASEDQLRL